MSIAAAPGPRTIDGVISGNDIRSLVIPSPIHGIFLRCLGRLVRSLDCVFIPRSSRLVTESIATCAIT